MNIHIDRRRIAELRETLERRKSKLNEATERLSLGQQDLQDSDSVLERSVHTHQRLFHKLNRRKKELIADLFSIYPIEQVRFRGVKGLGRSVWGLGEVSFFCWLIM